MAPGHRYTAAILDSARYLKMFDVDLETYRKFRRRTGVQVQWRSALQTALNLRVP